jgi:hypothetical protein
VSSRTAARRRGPTWSERGSAAVDHGDLDAARTCFAEAVRQERGNALHRYHLAVVQEALGEVGAAGASLTEALHLAPGLTEAARRLSLLAGRCSLPGEEPLDPAGLKAALAYDTVDREPIAEAAMRHLAATGPLAGALAAGRTYGWLAAARGLCRDRTAPLLRDELFLTVLRTSVFRGAEIERLLTALRRALLLDAAAERLQERALFELALALAQQCHINEHVWAVSEEEAAQVAGIGLDAARLLDGDPAEGCRLVLGGLYAPFTALLGDGMDPREGDRIRPRALRDVVARHLADAADERRRRAGVARLGGMVGAPPGGVAPP